MTAGRSIKTLIGVIYALAFRVLLFIWAVLGLTSLMVPALTVRDAFDGDWTLRHVWNAVDLATTPLVLGFVFGSLAFFALGFLAAPLLADSEER